MNMNFIFCLIVVKAIGCDAALRIIGGRNALQDEFPFAVRLEQKVTRSSADHNTEYEKFCTGAAVASEWILSAAHCYIEDQEIFARYNSYLPKIMGQITPIIEVYIHPHFSENTLDEESIIRYAQNDIALFHCKHIHISQYARISAIDYKTLIGHEVNVLGFGCTNASDAESTLQVLNGMINNCFKKELIEMAVETAPMCVFPSCKVKATICGGDSGGPVVHPSGIVGVNSMSMDDCHEHTTSLEITPGSSASVAAIVSHSLDWITKVVTNKTTTS